jgi:hypothetical protein
MRRILIPAGLIAALILSAGCGVGSTVDSKEATDVLQIAATTAVAYGVTHSGTYNGMDAAGLAMINGQLQWTDAEPQPGQIQIATADGDNYRLVYKNPKGAVFTATRQNGTVVFADAKGNKI